MSNFKDHFSGHSAQYAAYRPTYPPALVDFLADTAPAHDRALDCACGTGQLSTLLGARFDEVIAIDASSEQIAHATPHPRVRYQTARAEDSGLAEGSVDLITVAQAAHWLDLDSFYTEARRVARPRAVVALITYGLHHVDDAALDALTRHFYEEVVGPYWPPERPHVEDGYRQLPFPFGPIAAPVMSLEAMWALEDLLGYVSTWSAVKAAEKAQGPGPMTTFREQMATAWGDPSVRRRVRWPISMRVGRVSP